MEPPPVVAAAAAAAVDVKGEVPMTLETAAAAVAAVAAPSPPAAALIALQQQQTEVAMTAAVHISATVPSGQAMHVYNSPALGNDAPAPAILVTGEDYYTSQINFVPL